MKVDWLVVGAGFTGATIAERLASRGERVLVIDRRDHIAGNAHDRYNERNHLVHQYGPHIFHTNSEKVWTYLSQFTSWRPYEHRVLGRVEGQLVPIPFNLASLATLLPSAKATAIERELLATYGMDTKVPILSLRQTTSPDLQWLADYIYEHVFLGYTTKMWGLTPEELDPSVTGRVPVHISHDDRYFQDRYQAMPEDGYTVLFQKMLSHANIEVQLGTDLQDVEGQVAYSGLVYTGSLDALFDHELGPLAYRSLDFRYESHDEDLRQPVGTVNYPGPDGPTRSTEQKHLTGQQVPGTTLVWEYPKAHRPGESEAYYPIPQQQNRALYEAYLRLAETRRPNMVLAGRLADYKYYNMDQAVGRALALVEKDARLQR